MLPVGQANVEKAGRVAGTPTITFTSLTAALAEGTVDLSFDDGSKVAGSFSVPICTTTLPESSICF